MPQLTISLITTKCIKITRLIQRGKRREAKSLQKSYYDYYTSNSEFADIEPDETLIAEVGASGGEVAPDIENADARLSTYSSKHYQGNIINGRYIYRPGF